MSASPRKIRPLTGGAIRSALSQLINAAAGAMTTLVLARILGPAGAGVYAVALSLLLGLLTFGTLSLQSGINYFVGTGRWTAHRALAETQGAALILGVISIAVALGIRAVFPSAFRGLDVGLTVVTAAAVPFAMSWTFASAVALAIDHYELYAVPAPLQAIVGLVAIVTLGATHGVAGAIIGMTLSHLVTAVFTLWWCRKAVQMDRDRAATPGQLWPAVVFGLKSHLANALTFITYRLDLFILNGTASASQVGQYSVAVSVTQATWLLPRALSAVVMPRIAQVSAGQAAVGEDYQELVERKSVRHATILAFASAVGLVGALLVIVLLFLGPRFYESIELGLILLPGSILLGIIGALSAVLVGRGRPEYSFFAAALTTPVAIVLYFILIPALSAVGAALASSLAYAFGFLVGVVLARRMLGRGVVQLIVPTRSELDDYRRLIASLRRTRRRVADR